MIVSKRANVVGLGLIGGSVAAALGERGWHVSGTDDDPERCSIARERGLIKSVGVDAGADVSVVATPVSSIVGWVNELLATTRGVVTDVGSVKAPIARAVTDARFIAGHPMAGSELQGVDGADPNLFRGAVWVLTPTQTTSDDTFATVAQMVRSIDADVLVLRPEEHDRLVAVTSHLPHLTAATLMSIANDRADDHAAVMRLAAGGFRDMTRVASGHPAIWLDICRENKEAIVDAIDSMIAGLDGVRRIVSESDDDALLRILRAAREARANLPGRVRDLADVVELRIPIPDRAGAAAEVFSLAAELGVNTANFEVVHSVEGDRGILVMIVASGDADVFRGGLRARGFKVAVASVR
jgi:prephenate dehydrogenase